MGVAGDAVAPAVEGRALFEMHCAQCHGVTGEGGYYGPSFRAPAIAGVAATKVAHQVRSGGRHMPAFSAAALPEGALEELGTYVHEGLSRPTRDVGPRALDPFVVGVLVWIALALFACGLAATFAEGRN